MPQRWFGEVADTLLNRSVMVINKVGRYSCVLPEAYQQPFRLAEVEFYLTHPTAMPDPYPHNDPIQVNRGLWYGPFAMVFGFLDAELVQVLSSIWRQVLPRGVIIAALC